MLRKLVLSNVGPATHMAMEPIAPRINLITGDNGLGKSFLLDIGWWALTRTWAGAPAVPTAQDAASIGYSFDGEKGLHDHVAPWQRKDQEWKRKGGRPPNPGLVLYARIDGSFSVWDPMRNYALYSRQDGVREEFVHAFHFNAEQVMSGLQRSGSEAMLCEGLLRDWTLWQLSNDPRFALLKRLLASLGPEGQALDPGEPRYPYAGDDRRIPTIKMPYRQEVPVTYAPAGVQRIIKVAYLLAWAFSSHERECLRTGAPTSKQIILLIDEPETHLHPRWQRSVLPSLVEAVKGWNAATTPSVQALVATHSPLVLASMEPTFDPLLDALWKLDLVDGDVVIERDSWRKRGDANMWLISDVFDLRRPYSREADDALQEAEKLMARPEATEAEMVALRATLRRVLVDTDPFWLSWRYWIRERGWTA